MASRRLIERYILTTIFPYALAALVLLTGVLFVQQTGRYFETIFRDVVPASFVYGLALALLPTVLIFTLPAAVLCGTIIGLGRMSSDSELIVMRAAGISIWRTLWPALAIGMMATLASGYLNLVEAPQAQRDIKSVAVRTALYKLDSPVEPRTFTTDFPGQVIYVRDGDTARGQWGRIFIQSAKADHSTDLITARTGRIDSSSEKSELVLEDAMQTHVPAPDAKDQSYVVDRLASLRVNFNTGRSSVLEKLQKQDPDPDEMGFNQLRQFISTNTGTRQREAAIVFHKRLAFALSPFVFSLFGAALALRLRRGGRGFGIMVSLLILLLYYVVTLGGDHLARAGTIPPAAGAWTSTILTLGFGIILLIARDRSVHLWSFRRQAHTEVEPSAIPVRRRRWRRRISIASFPMLLDVGLVRTLFLSFAFAFIALVLIFDVFTTFELWRFMAANKAPAKLVVEYLFYLLPLVSVEIFPASVLVAVLMTYALIARRREAVAWWATGQSAYRLMLPGLIFAIVVGAGAWFIQERLMPQANVEQDDLRARIRGNITGATAGAGRRWLVSADGSRIYAYEFDDTRQMLVKPVIFEFDSQLTALKRVINGEEGKWLPQNQFEISQAHWFNLDQPIVARESAERLSISGVDPPNAFKPTVDRPSQFSSSALSDYVKNLRDRGVDTTSLKVALQRKYASPFGAIVMALIGMPLAIWFGRKSTVLALCSAVGVSLAFWLISGGFEQLGEHSLLPAAAAVWTPIVMFACSGLYLISRVRT
jgi:LPS export ABC transporter permease LptF/LPS export ABC transporter permease LptG